MGFPCGSADKESACNAGDLGLISELGRSPGEGNGYPRQYSGLENFMDYSPWSRRVAGLSDLHFTSLKIDWFDLLAVQGTLRSLLQHHSLKASILWHSAFFMVQLSQLDMTTGKTIALTIQTFVSRVMSLLFNTLSRFVIAFLCICICISYITVSASQFTY